MRRDIVMPFIFVAAIGAVAGCTEQQGRPESATDSDGVTEDAAGTLLTSIIVEPKHAIRFYEVEPGLMFVTESGELDKQPALLEQQKIESYVDVFRVIAPGRTVPPALVAAEQRRSASRAQGAVEQPPDTAFTSNGEGPSFYTTGEQTWFRQTFCPTAVQCIQGWDWIDSGWDLTNSWRTTAMVGSEGTAVAPHVAYRWQCVLFGACSWQPLITANVSPGFYHWVSQSGGAFYFKSTLTGAGGGTQVSMAIEAARPPCAACNDGSCQCGFATDASLCSGHGGINHEVGCIRQGLQ